MEQTEVTPDASPEIAVALVEDDRRFRDAMRRLVEGFPGFSCVADYGSVEEALRGKPTMSPQVVLLDINLPGLSGDEGVGLVRERFPEAVVLMLTVFEDEDRIFRSLCNGAGGYILKRTPPVRLLGYLREAASGGAPMSPEIARKVIGLFKDLAPPLRLDCKLTPQELRLLALLAEGHSYQGAADALGVTINTVRNYVRSIYDKLHVHSKSAAVSKALRAGLI
jgi:DNA-binding NarL/FixJ family response regulator